MSESDLEKDEEKKPNWANFGIGTAIIVAFILIIMIIGSLFLYTVKVGASGILPTNINIDTQCYGTDMDLINFDQNIPSDMIA
jgi:hypothetical protein